MTVGQCRSCLKCQSAEAVEVAVDPDILQRAALQVLHQLVVTVLTVLIGTSEVQQVNNHLKLERAYQLQQLLVDVEVGIVQFQYVLLSFTLYQVHLRLTGVVAQTGHLLVVNAFQGEHIIRRIARIYYRRSCTAWAHRGLQGALFGNITHQGLVATYQGLVATYQGLVIRHPHQGLVATYQRLIIRHPHQGLVATYQGLVIRHPHQGLVAAYQRLIVVAWFYKHIGLIQILVSHRYLSSLISCLEL